MKLIIPMAGRGTRLRPHTHVTPKPLMSVVGLSMVERIIETFMPMLSKKLDEAVFILGDFPAEVNEQLTEICERHGIKAHFAYQERPLGTGHAVSCAGDHLNGEGIIVFADTLFYMEKEVSFGDADGIIWVKHVEDPSRYGVVVKTGDRITDFVEKPLQPISNEAIIGVYYIRELAVLRAEIQTIIREDLHGRDGEYQLTDALDRMLKQGRVFKTASVSEWLDCGTIPALMATTWRILEKEGAAPPSGTVEDSVIIDPVFIGSGARVTRSVVGPYVSIEPGAEITDAVVQRSILFDHARVKNAVLEGSLVGRHASIEGRGAEVNIGDHATIGGA